MRSALFPRAFSFMVQVKLGKKLLGCPAIGQQSYFLSRAKPGRIPPLLLPSQGPSAASAAWTPHSSRPSPCPCLHTHAHSPEGRARRTAHPRSPFLGLGGPHSVADWSAHVQSLVTPTAPPTPTAPLLSMKLLFCPVTSDSWGLHGLCDLLGFCLPS